MQRQRSVWVQGAAGLLLAAALAGCGKQAGGNSASTSESGNSLALRPTHDNPVHAHAVETVGVRLDGKLSGLQRRSRLTLGNGGVEMLSLSANGHFEFSTHLPRSGLYDIGVVRQPTGQHCSVNNGKGKAGPSHVISITIACRRALFGK